MGTGLQLDSMRVDGGMTANNLLMQMQADLANVNVLRAKTSEATSLGAAMAAALAVGFWSRPEQVEEFLGGHEHFSPRMLEKERCWNLERWCDALERSFSLSKWDSQRSTEPLEAEQKVSQSQHFAEPAPVDGA